MRIFGQHDDQTILQLQRVRERAVDAALMADGHVGYVMPIGGVAAYRDRVSVVGVGFDIACGNAAMGVHSAAEGSAVRWRRPSWRSGRASRGAIAHRSTRCCSSSPRRSVTTTGTS